MTRGQKLSELVYEAAESAATAAFITGEGEEFLIQTCGWTLEEVEGALEGYEEEVS